MTLLPAHREFLIEHLPYELEMLEWSYAALHEDRLSKFREHNLIGNLAVESFWVHVRNLIDFFNQPRNGSETGSASASDFIKSQRFDANLSRKTLKDEINNQITHLQYGRPTTLEGKLNSARMADVIGAIRKAVKLFEADLRDEAREVWIPRQKLEITLTTEQIAAACTVISTTAAIGSISIVGPSSLDIIAFKSS